VKGGKFEKYRGRGEALYEIGLIIINSIGNGGNMRVESRGKKRKIEKGKGTPFARFSTRTLPYRKGTMKSRGGGGE